MIFNNTSNSNKIKVNPEYPKLVNPLSNLEYETLKNSIKKDGLYYPIVINSKYEILDGHHRYKICKELNLLIKYETKYFDDYVEEKRFVIDINLKRRQLNDFQKAELAYKLEDIYKEQARKRQLSNLKNVKDNLSSLGSNDPNEKNQTIQREEEEKGRVIDVVSKNHGLSPKTYQRAKTIIENGAEKIKEKLRRGKTTISKEFDNIQKDIKRIELLAQIQQLQNNNDENDNLNNNYKLINADFTKQSQYEIPDESIDLIFTDPPYGKEYLSLYPELAQLASRVLKPGGSLVTFAGHIILNEIFNIFHNYSLTNNNNSNILKYWWTLAVKHSGRHQKIYPRFVFAEWKPLVWFVKGDRANNLVISNTIGDYIESNPPSKLLHEWEQSPVEAEYIIKNLTIENQIVLDPMMGSGTTGLAALNLGRKFVGIEINSTTFEIAKSNIGNLNNR